MKAKKVLLLAALLSAIVLHAQEDRPYQSFFGKESTQWNGYTETYDISVDKNHTLVTSYDTVMDGKTYKKIEHSWSHKGGDSRLKDEDSRSVLYLREDTTTGRLWYRDPYESDEYLIADMSLKKRDSVVMHLRHYLFPDDYDTVTFVVYDTQTVDGRYTVSLYASFWRSYSDITFIEGIGCSNLISYLYEPPEEMVVLGSGIVCCHKDGELVYHHIEDWMIEEGDCKVDYIGIDEARAERVSVYPNPCGDWITLDGERAQSVILYDMTGRKLDVDIKADGRIHTGNLPSGVYLLRAVLENSTITKTIIKK